MMVLKGANLALRFLLELGVLVALCYWGFRSGEGTFARIALGLGVPLIVAVVWSTVMSPKARVRPPWSLHLAAEMVIFGLGPAALFATGQPLLGWIFAAAAVFSRALIFVWQQESISHGRRWDER
jgi:hypothetical protein